MNAKKIKEAVAAAKVFVARAACLLHSEPLNDNSFHYYGSKHSAAVKRASMDLTRALAEMRRPG